MAIKKVTAKKATVKKPVMKSGGAKKSLAKAQTGKQTPFQQYMKTPGAVASDTVMSRKPFSSTHFDRSTLEKPKAKNPQNTKALIDASEKTYGMDVWDRPWTTATKNKYLTPAEEKEFRRMGPLKKKGGTVAKPKMQKGGSTVQQVKKEKDAILKRQDAITREQDIKAAKSSSDYYKSRANDLRRVQKVYPTVNRFNELKNEYNKKAVEANKEKVELNASKYKKTGGSTKMKKGGSTGDKKWIQKATASIKRRGTEGKCTPITKPGCTGKARTLALTFKKMAKARKSK